MDIAVLIAHEVKIAERNCDRLCADAEKAADIDDRRAAGADAVYVVNLPDLVVIGAIDGRAF